MKQTIFLLLTLLIVATNANPPKRRSIITQFSIYTFLNYLHENDLYDLIYWAKCEYGDDIAIGLCQELVSSVFCQPTVVVYMPDCPVPRRARARGEIQELKSIREFIYEHLDILLKQYSRKEIEIMIKKLEAYIKKLQSQESEEE